VLLELHSLGSDLITGLFSGFSSVEGKRPCPIFLVCEAGLQTSEVFKSLISWLMAWVVCVFNGLGTYFCQLVTWEILLGLD
jgi:hypothetical protein